MALRPFARNLKFLLLTLDDFRVRGIDFVSLQDNIDTSTPTGRLAFAIIGAVSEMEKEMNRERTRSGIAAARRRGAQIGRPRVRVEIGVARQLLAQGHSIRAVAKKLGVGASTLTRALRSTAPETPVDPDLDEPPIP
ncbi:MAG: recombinase family protein [Polyangiaceae bacterium]|nr:recombinase family protein [Polyangiaceae bacterium]